MCAPASCSDSDSGWLDVWSLKTEISSEILQGEIGKRGLPEASACCSLTMNGKRDLSGWKACGIKSEESQGSGRAALRR